MSGFDNDVVNCKNWDYRQTSPVQGQATSGGDLPIGTGGSPEIEVGQIVSSDSTIDVSYSNPNIDIKVSASSVTSVNTTYTAQESDYFINCTANSFTVTLPAATSLSGS